MVHRPPYRLDSNRGGWPHDRPGRSCSHEDRRRSLRCSSDRRPGSALNEVSAWERLAASLRLLPSMRRMAKSGRPRVYVRGLQEGTTPGYCRPPVISPSRRKRARLEGSSVYIEDLRSSRGDRLPLRKQSLLPLGRFRSSPGRPVSARRSADRDQPGHLSASVSPSPSRSAISTSSPRPPPHPALLRRAEGCDAKEISGSGASS